MGGGIVRPRAAVLGGVVVCAAAFAVWANRSSVRAFEIELATTDSGADFDLAANFAATGGVLEELDLRIGAEEPPTVLPLEPPRPKLSPAAIECLVLDLRDDDKRFNAIDAYRTLRMHPEASARLARALLSDDRQQRQLAVLLLWHFDVEPTARLAEISVEGLHADRLPYDRESGRYVPIDNARTLTVKLDTCRELARPYLRRALASADPQQRFLSAMLLGRQGDVASAFRVSEILLPHLGDNDMPADATLGANALGGLLDVLRPHLARARFGVDGQARAMIDRLLRGPTAAERDAGLEGHMIWGRKLEMGRFVDFEGRSRYTLPPRR